MSIRFPHKILEAVVRSETVAGYVSLCAVSLFSGSQPFLCLNSELHLNASPSAPLTLMKATYPPYQHCNFPCTTHRPTRYRSCLPARLSVRLSVLPENLKIY